MKLELVGIPVTDVDRAKEFYVTAGFVADADRVCEELAARGIPVSEVDEQPWGRFVYFSDPDGNAWSLQQLPSWSTGAGGSGEDPHG